jgi:hypothetical protein
VINGITNPIVSSATFTMVVDPNTGVPATTGTSIMVPSKAPVVGNTMGWFSGRVYAPSATLDGHEDITVIFAGYHTPKPKNGLGDYRTIGRVSLHSSQQILARSNDAGAGDDEDNNGNQEANHLKSDLGKGCAHIDEDVRCGPFSFVRIDSVSTPY